MGYGHNGKFSLNDIYLSKIVHQLRELLIRINELVTRFIARETNLFNRIIYKNM